MTSVHWLLSSDLSPWKPCTRLPARVVRGQSSEVRSHFFPFSAPCPLGLAWARPGGPPALLSDPHVSLTRLVGVTTAVEALGLNPEQLRAATHGEGPLLVIAGAGT